MATHSSVLGWRIPGMGEPGGLPSMGSHRVGHDWSNLAAAAATCLWACRFQLSSSPFAYQKIMKGSVVPHTKFIAWRCRVTELIQAFLVINYRSFRGVNLIILSAWYKPDWECLQLLIDCPTLFFSFFFLLSISLWKFGLKQWPELHLHLTHLDSRHYHLRFILIKSDVTDIDYFWRTCKTFTCSLKALYRLTEL